MYVYMYNGCPSPSCKDKTSTAYVRAIVKKNPFFNPREIERFKEISVISQPQKILWS